MNLRMFELKVGHGTYSRSPMKHASLAPRKMVKSRVGAAQGAVARHMMRSKSDDRSDEV